MDKKFCRSVNDSLIAGVCGGIGEFFNVDSNIIRLIFIIFGFFGAGVFVYILLWIFVPTFDFLANDHKNSDSKIFDMGEKDNIFNIAKQKNNASLFAIVLIFVGLLLLLNNFFHIFSRLNYYLNLSRVWPAILIVIGLVLIIKRNK